MLCELYSFIDYVPCWVSNRRSERVGERVCKRNYLSTLLIITFRDVHNLARWYRQWYIATIATIWWWGQILALPWNKRYPTSRKSKCSFVRGGSRRLRPGSTRRIGKRNYQYSTATRTFHPPTTWSGNGTRANSRTQLGATRICGSNTEIAVSTRTRWQWRHQWKS